MLCKCNRLSYTESPFQCQFDQTCSVLECNKKDSNAISNLALKVGKNLECVLSNVFSLEPHEKVEDLCDRVRSPQWKLYQCESDQNVTVDKVLPENLEPVKETGKVSYWENAFKAFGLNVLTKLPKH